MWRNGSSSVLARDLGAAIIAPAMMLAAAELIHSTLGLSRLGLLFLAAVILVASIRGRRASIFAALISVIAYKFFLDWRTGGTTTAIEMVMNLVIFLVVALITGALAGKVHDGAEKARRHAQSMELLFKTGRTLSDANEDDFWLVITQAIMRGSGGASVALNLDGEVLAQSGAPADTAAAAKFGAQVLHDAPDACDVGTNSWRARKIPSEGPCEGLLVWDVLDPDDGGAEFVELVVDLASASRVRSRARQEAVRHEAAEEASKLREALLSSISHDFRSPLAAIIGSATSLLEYGDKFDEATEKDLLLNIRDEGEKLNQFVANLLNMTRLQSGVVQPNKVPLEVANVIGSAVRRLKLHHGTVPSITVNADCDILADPLLLEQAVYNLLDNAAKYAANDKGIRVSCTNHERHSEILVADHGPGLPAEDRAGVFSTFHYARKNGRVNGTGLGLSISRGFVEAMQGTIEARDRRDGQSGLEVAITLPRSLA